MHEMSSIHQALTCIHKLSQKYPEGSEGNKSYGQILNHLEIKKQKMGLLDAVGKGAADGPNLIVVEYWGAGKPKKGDKKNCSGSTDR